MTACNGLLIVCSDRQVILSDCPAVRSSLNTHSVTDAGRSMVLKNRVLIIIQRVQVVLQSSSPKDLDLIVGLFYLEDIG